LERKSKSSAIVIPPRQGKEPGVVGSEVVPMEYKPFVLQGIVSLVDAGEESPVTILRDTGASQSLILTDVLPFSTTSATGTSVLLQGVELGIMRVPLHRIILKCSLVNGPVIVGVRPSLLVQGITVLLGNDLAGGRIIESPRVSEELQMKCDEVEQIPELFPVCAVTQAMARARSSPTSPPEQDDIHIPGNSEDQPLSLSDTFLGKSSIDTPTLSSSANPLANEVEVSNVLSRQDLIREQEGDPEIMSLSKYAVEEKEAAVESNCYFWKKGVLMRKWRSPVIPASDEWKVFYQIILPWK